MKKKKIMKNLVFKTAEGANGPFTALCDGGSFCSGCASVDVVVHCSPILYIYIPDLHSSACSSIAPTLDRGVPQYNGMHRRGNVVDIRGSVRGRDLR